MDNYNKIDGWYYIITEKPVGSIKLKGQVLHKGWDIPSNWAIDSNKQCWKDNAHGATLNPCTTDELLLLLKEDDNQDTINAVMGLLGLSKEYQFRGFSKISRLNRTTIVTEKIDGTNALIYIPEDCPDKMLVGSRTQWITPEKDNYGFARWAQDNKEELLKLGPGSHYGEWAGLGIQRRYGLKEKRFYLFNATRWTDEVRPKCCYVVPVLSQHTDIRHATDTGLQMLRDNGSYINHDFKNPEGVVAYHTASGQLFKITLDNDGERKGKVILPKE
jgi:hypothetical protein